MTQIINASSVTLENFKKAREQLRSEADPIAAIMRKTGAPRDQAEALVAGVFSVTDAQFAGAAKEAASIVDGFGKRNARLNLRGEADQMRAGIDFDGGAFAAACIGGAIGGVPGAIGGVLIYFCFAD